MMPQQVQTMREHHRHRPRINLERLVSNIRLDATLLRWFAYNGRREDMLIAIDE